MTTVVRAITLEFGDDSYPFLLDWARLLKLEEARGCGPLTLFRRLHDETFRVEDIADVIRLGLTGGGMLEIKAKKLVREHVEPAPLATWLLVAQEVLGVAVFGNPEPQQVPLGEADEAMTRQ